MTDTAADDTTSEDEPFLRSTRKLGPDSFRAWTVNTTQQFEYELVAWISVDGEHWIDSEHSGPFGTWQDAVRCDPQLTLLRSGQAANFDISANPFRLAEMCTCDPADELTNWPSNSVATISEHELFFLRQGPGQDAIPFLTGPDGEIIGDEVASYFADSFHPGDFTESRALVEYAPGLAVYISDGDMDNDFTPVAELIVLSDSPSSRASGISQWLGQLSALGQYSAMLELAVLDPEGQLADEQRTDWEVALTHPYCRVKFAIDDVTRAELSAMIVPSDITEAHESPCSEAGRALLALQN